MDILTIICICLLALMGVYLILGILMTIALFVALNKMANSESDCGRK